MDQLFKESVLMSLIIGFNLGQLFVYFKLRHILNGPAQGSNLLTDALEGEGLPPTSHGTIPPSLPSHNPSHRPRRGGFSTVRVGAHLSPRAIAQFLLRSQPQPLPSAT
ncbi:hypothetical protein MPTK1_2g26080 [Marchantia polymorpha subsp. ruderalis]|uniref:Uncharacterized protein n=1 Tax=Marchantia polymorpha TaxID=3197 RepID=A0A2R6XB81_MARPO|nr:hypothetical protein MARPO_0025s0071 [Marchantia polymorpha]BBN03752.1 hypothetical protein Mp_2g26080 [Marchantia polymorpha subsp. ruderalis]|eukprot:PTQ43380.1 hypothetical protein MARPO_0025s0071 [Marchantia polymorpha]